MGKKQTYQQGDQSIEGLAKGGNAKAKPRQSRLYCNFYLSKFFT